MTNKNTTMMVAPTLDSSLAAIEENKLIRMASLAKRSVVVGSGKSRRAINDNEAAALALISMATGASFVNGELYLTDTGPMFGVPLYERKADEYMWALMPGTSFHINYRPAIPGIDASFDPDKGDFGIVAELTRDDWDATWKKSYSEYFTMLIGAGAPWVEADKRAMQMAGVKPSLTFAAVVDARESFSGYEWENGQATKERKPESFDRIERARKRARKGVLKHGFPRLNLPEPADILSNPIASKLVEVVKREIDKAPAPILSSTVTMDRDGIVTKREVSEDVILSELGFNGQEKQQGNSVIIETDTEQFPDGDGHRFDLNLDYQDSDFDPSELEAPFDEEVDAKEKHTAADDSVWNSAVENTIKARVGFTDPKKLLEAFKQSQFLTPGMKQPIYNMWASFYVQKRGKNEATKEQAIEHADRNTANLQAGK